MDSIYLGWGPRPLQRAAQALVECMGEDSGRWSYVLPGRRAVRQFEAALARVLPAHLEPPRGIPQGAWLGVFRPTDRVAIPMRESIHAWTHVLRGLSAGELRLALGVEPPRPDAAGAWWVLGQRARDLHAEVCQADMDFAILAGKLPAQAARWRLWAELQARYRGDLERQGLGDGLADCRTAPVRSEGLLAFIGVPTAGALERRTLEELGERFLPLVIAPEKGEAFDDLGLLQPEAWTDALVPLPMERWMVEEDPAGQARRVCHVLHDWSQAGELAAKDVVLAAPDEEVRPFLERHLERVGLKARDAAGFPLDQCAPALLIHALARMVPDLRFADVASVLRHVDMEAALLREGGDGADGIAGLDAYHVDHLPRHFREELIRGRGRSLAAHGVWQAALRGLGDLLDPAPRPLASWVAPLRNFLQWVYGEHEFSESHPVGRVTAACLRALGSALDDWESGSGPWLPQATASGALTLL
ncbi:MAG: hypothetical protein KDB61_07705, partial [Planctomycetes bacterium]|nr:hypothetical protein [Planctomycetota bacterium]